MWNKEPRETELAFKVADRIISIQECEEGYDYSIMDEKFCEIDGGVYDNPDVDIRYGKYSWKPDHSPLHEAPLLQHHKEVMKHLRFPFDRDDYSDALPNMPWFSVQYCKINKNPSNLCNLYLVSYLFTFLFRYRRNSNCYFFQNIKQYPDSIQ